MHGYFIEDLAKIHGINLLFYDPISFSRPFIIPSSLLLISLLSWSCLYRLVIITKLLINDISRFCSSSIGQTDIVFNHIEAILG